MPLVAITLLKWDNSAVAVTISESESATKFWISNGSKTSSEPSISPTVCRSWNEPPSAGSGRRIVRRIGSENSRPSGCRSYAAMAVPSTMKSSSSSVKAVIAMLLGSTPDGMAPGGIVSDAEPSDDSTVIGKSAFSEVA